jgi:peptidoglycan hydrolase CwlO-like protein
MAEQMVVDESKLQEMIALEVAKALRAGYQDMDEIRKSPAGVIIRVETEIENLQEKVEVIEAKVDRLSAQAEAHRAEAKEENAELRVEIKALRKDNEMLRAELTKNNETLRGEIRTESQNLRNEMATKSHITLIYGLLIALVGFVGTIMVKMFFFTP